MSPVYKRKDFNKLYGRIKHEVIRRVFTSDDESLENISWVLLGSIEGSRVGVGSDTSSK